MAEGASNLYSPKIFPDEATFWDWLPLKRAWSTRNTRLIQRTIKHSVKMNGWGCFLAVWSSKYAKRLEAVFLYKHANGPKLSFPSASAVKVIKKSKGFIARWVKRFLSCLKLSMTIMSAV